MRVVLDTNVLVSAVFFGGVPHKVLEAWRDGLIQLVASPSVIDEYQRVGDRLAQRFPGVSLTPFLVLMLTHGEVIDAPELPAGVCSDPDDDKFLACAVAGRCDLVVSGDRHLLEVSEFRGIRVLRPRDLLDMIGKRDRS